MFEVFPFKGLVLLKEKDKWLSWEKRDQHRMGLLCRTATDTLETFRSLYRANLTLLTFFNAVELYNIYTCILFKSFWYIVQYDWYSVLSLKMITFWKSVVGLSCWLLLFHWTWLDWWAFQRKWKWEKGTKHLIAAQTVWDCLVPDDYDYNA